MPDKIMIFKVPERDFNDSDEYGLKKMLGEVIEYYTCPKCRDGKGGLGFLVWENEAEGLAVCSKCGIKKQFKPKSSSSFDSTLKTK
jgi:transcription elongation factor Elf1